MESSITPPAFSLRAQCQGRFEVHALAATLAAAVALVVVAPAHADTITFTPDSSVILNPERGLTQLMEVADYTHSQIDALRPDNHTLAWGKINLNAYTTTATLPAAKIDEIKRWLDRCKTDHVKAVLRIVYHEVTTFTPPEASMTIQTGHLEQLGADVFLPYDDVIVAYQAGGIGAYGEWYYTPTAFTTAATRKQLLDKMFEVIAPDAFVMVRTPYYKQQYAAAGATTDHLLRLGHFNDCFQSNADDTGTYGCYPWPGSCSSIPTLQDIVATDSAAAPVGGETCNDVTLNNCSNILAAMDYYGYSFVNTLWYATIRSKWESQGCFDTIATKLGYHFELVSATVPDNVEAGQDFSVSVTVKNTGWAPMYRLRPVYIRLHDQSDNELVYYWTGADPRNWAPGGGTYTFSNTFTLPAWVTATSVTMSVWMPDNLPANYGIVDYAVRMANVGVWNASNANNVLKTSIPVGAPGTGWTVLASDDFESGWGHYSDGGGDCSRYTGGTHAHQGNAAADVQDNSGTASAFTLTNGIDVATPGYDEIKIEFWYKPVSMESGEDFWLQYWDGTAWYTVGSWARGADFSNNNFYQQSVVVSKSQALFPTDMKIRFRCDASDNGDDVYIDEVVISAR